MVRTGGQVHYYGGFVDPKNVEVSRRKIILIWMGIPADNRQYGK
jgi:hypothetical protein